MIPLSLYHGVVLLIMLHVAVVDAKTHRIANSTVKAVLGLGLLAPLIVRDAPLYPEIAVCVFGTVLLSFLLYTAGMGGGDTKIFIALSCVLGIHIVPVIVLSFAISGIVGILFVVRGKKSFADQLPMAPGIAMAMLITSMFLR